jgi:hypothetical protein
MGRQDFLRDGLRFGHFFSFEFRLLIFIVTAKVSQGPPTFFRLMI